MTRHILSTLGAAALLIAAAPSLQAQGKGKGSDKAQAASHKSHDDNASRAVASQDKGRGKDAQARGGKAADRDDNRRRGAPGTPAVARDNERGRSDDMNRGRARSAEVRELGGAVAGPADMANAKAGRKAFKSSLKSGKYFRAFDSDDAPESFRVFALSPRLSERYVGRLATLAIARGIPENMLVITPTGSDRVVIANSNGVVLLDLDERRARNLGAWRVVALNDDDDRDREGSPAFCRSGAGHPNWGRQWCIDKGFGLGSDNDVRWGRAVSVQDVILRRTNTTGDLTRDVLASVLGDVVFNRLAAHALTLGLAEPLVGRWAVEPSGRRVLLVNSGTVPVAEVVDSNKDDRADVLLVALKPW